MLINLLASTCIHKLMKKKYVTGRFTNINASWPGSVHDAHIFRTSQVYS